MFIAAYPRDEARFTSYAVLLCFDRNSLRLILLVAVAIGLLAGWARARVDGRPYTLPDLRLTWLAAIAFLPQWLVFGNAPTRSRFSDRDAAVALVISQLLFSGVGVANRHHPAFRLLTLGLLANLTVIAANGGLMPMSPETVRRLAPNLPDSHWKVGQRFGKTKDRIIPERETTFAWLSDRFLLAPWYRYRVAYSVGDVLIAAGAFWFLWAAGGVHEEQ